MTSDPEAMFRALARPFAFAGLAYAAPGASDRFHIATAPGLTASPDTFWRAASISKIVTGRTLRATLNRPDATAEDFLGHPLRNPVDDRPVTLAQLATHTSGLSDAAGYLLGPGVALSDWLAAAQGAIWSGQAAGRHWDYCNLGYIVLAACAEIASGRPFDLLAQDLVLGPADVAAGFNWAGLLDRSDRIATFRRDGDVFLPQIDAMAADQGISDPAGQSLPRPPFVPGEHIAQFSPQGGLRMTLRGALRLAQGLAPLPDEPLWANPHPATADNPFSAQGWGLQLIAPGPLYPRPLIGHFANAYGMCGGIWRDMGTGGSFAYILNGLPLGDDSDALRPQELAILAAMAQALG